jgi:DNA polymerase III epsilon subunit-like protein
MRNYSQFILEHKFWGKSISEFLNWIKGKSDKYWVLCDTETTGLPSDPYEIQLTQISCIVIKYDYDSNSFKEIDTYNKKLKLSDTSLGLMKEPENRIKKVLSFNHYGQTGIEFHDEMETLQDFFEFLKPYDNPMLVIQNAEFDMRYLNTRSAIVKFDNEVLDTKQLAQLFYLPCLQKLAETDPKFADMIKKIGKSDRDNGLISSSLSKIGPALGINMTGYHDALVDTKLMMQMFQSIIEFLKHHQDVDIRKYQAERIKTKK